jgi:hypothetical protein
MIAVRVFLVNYDARMKACFAEAAPSAWGRRRTSAPPSAAVIVLLVAGPSLSAIDLDVTTQDVERALSIARGRDKERERFHASYIQKLATPAVETVEVVSEFRRYVLSTEDHIRKGERKFSFSTALAQQALAPWKTRLSIIARLRFHPQNRYITVPAAEIALVGNDRALIGVLKDPIMGLSSGRASDGSPLMGAVVEGVFDAVVVGEGVREFVVRLEGREVARVTFDLRTLE